MRRPLAASFAVSLSIQAGNVVTGILLARGLGLHDRGVLAAVILWPSLLAAIGHLGLPEAVTYYTAQAEIPRRFIIGTSLAIAALQSLAMVLIGFLLVPPVLGHFGDDAVRLALVFLAFVPLNLFTVALMGFLNGQHRFTAFNALRGMVVLLAAAVIVVLAVAGSLTPATAACAYLGANGATLLAAMLIVARTGEFDLAVSRSAARTLMSFGVKSHLGNVSSMLSERLDQLVISVFLAPAKLGLYVVAVTLTSLVGLIGSTVGLVALPVLARLKSVPEQLAAGRRLIGLTLGCASLVAAPMIVFTPELLELFFGASFRAASGPARILLVGAVLLTTGRVLSTILKALGRPLQASVTDMAALGVTAVALAVLLPSFGLLGAAASSVLAYGLSFAWMVDRTAQALSVRRLRLFLPEHPLRRNASAPIVGATPGGEGR